MKSLLSAFTALALLLAPASGVAAVTLFSNVNETLAGILGPISANTWMGSDFITGADPTLVEGLTMNLKNRDSIDHNVFAQIWSNNAAGRPGGLVAGFDGTVMVTANSTDAPFTFTSGGGINLAADTIYWLVWGMEESGVTRGVGADSTDSNGTDAGSIYGTLSGTIVKETGNAWGQATNSPSGAANFKFNLTGIATPEPGRLVLFGLGMLPLLACRSRMMGAGKR